MKMSPWICAGAALFSAASIAAPAIQSASGQFTDGSSVQLSGSSFGSHNLDIEYLGGPDGAIENSESTVSSFGNWKIPGPTKPFYPVKAVTNRAHSGNKSWKIQRDQDGDGYWNGTFRYDYGKEIPENTHIFMSWWVSLDQRDGSGQWKMFRLRWNDDVNDTGTEVGMFNWHPGTDAKSESLTLRPYDSYDPQTKFWDDDGVRYPLNNARWYRLDFHVYTGTQGDNNGKVIYDLYDPEANKRVYHAINEQGTTVYGVDRRYRYFFWHNYFGNGLDQATVWYDDVYVQVGSQARVELCDQPSWSNRMHCEIQDLESWDNDTVSFNFMKGSFPTNSTAYLFVIDDNGNASPGYPVVIGGQGAGAPEPAPEPEPEPEPTPPAEPQSPPNFGFERNNN